MVLTVERQFEEQYKEVNSVFNRNTNDGNAKPIPGESKKRREDLLAAIDKLKELADKMTLPLKEQNAADFQKIVNSACDCQEKVHAAKARADATLFKERG